MNRNVMIVLAGGFLIAVLVALLVQASLSGGPAPEPVVLQEEPKVQIVVASKDLKMGDELNENNMKWQDWPKNAIFPGAVQKEDDKKPEEMISGRLRRPIKEGEPIIESALVQNEGNFIAAALTPGMRAVSIDVSPSGMVAGFVMPGDHVDIILTYNASVSYPAMDDPDSQEAVQRNLESRATETIMQNVKVLAVDQRTGSEEEEIAAKLGKLVTVEVDYQQAEILAITSQMGTLHLALRRLGDEEIVTDRQPVTTDARVTRIYEDILSEIMDPQGVNSSSNNSRFVRIYRGDNVESLSVSP